MTSLPLLRPLFAATVLLFALPGRSAAASKEAQPDATYADAKASYLALKQDPARRKLRHHWLNLARRFEQVASKHPKSPRAPEALFNAGQLFEDLSRISLLQEDRLSAASTYRKLVDLHPRDRLADDAALALARIELERLGKPDDARRTLKQALKKLPKGDKVKEITTLLASIPGNTEPSISKPVPTVLERATLVERIERLGKLGEVPSLADAMEEAKSPPPVAGVAEVASAEEAAPTPTAPPAVAEARPTRFTVPKVRSPADAGEPTLAQQLGLKMRRVVIDPGHGGHDTGAIGRGGTREKDVALAISEKLAAILEEEGLETVLTRDDDTYVALEERSHRANAAKGDLFVSIHCNAAASRKLHGVETYTLNVSSNRYAIRLAARENASSEKGMSDLQFILADLATKVNTDESRRLAGQVQSRLVQRLSGRHETKDLGTKEALFYVLLGAKMPAVLVETSFLSNPEEERLLSSAAYQKEVAEAIAGGIRSFLDDRQRVARMD